MNATAQMIHVRTQAPVGAEWRPVDRRLLIAAEAARCSLIALPCLTAVVAAATAAFMQLF